MGLTCISVMPHLSQNEKVCTEVTNADITYDTRGRNNNARTAKNH